ncbi:MAG: class I SAM-dependent methyltransferase [Chlamydiota bacterium]
MSHLHAVLTEIIAQIKPKSRVLEVGFGLASSQIIKYNPTSYIIIEADPKIAKEAMDWAKEYPNVTVIEGNWKTALAKLENFDAIFFNDYSARNDISCEEPSELVRKEKELMAHVKETIPHLTTIQYADHDLEMFCDPLIKESSKDVFRFLVELNQNGQISNEQLTRLIKKYNLEKEELNKKPPVSKPTDFLFPFVNECLEKHLSKGGLLAAFSKDATSRFENSLFFEKIITNYNYNYQEDKVFIDEDQRNSLRILIEKCT